MEEIIRTLSNEIVESDEIGERGDIADWNTCTGVLISRDKANEILEYLLILKRMV